MPKKKSGKKMAKSSARRVQKRNSQTLLLFFLGVLIGLLVFGLLLLAARETTKPYQLHSTTTVYK